MFVCVRLGLRLLYVCAPACVVCLCVRARACDCYMYVHLRAHQVSVGADNNCDSAAMWAVQVTSGNTCAHQAGGQRPSSQSLVLLPSSQCWC
jgi:hypothetical protein